MSVENIRELATVLEDHETAFMRDGGFSAAGSEHVYYLGYGGELTLPDGNTYEAYAKGWKSSSLRVVYFGHDHELPGLKKELAHITMLTHSGAVELAGVTVGEGRGRRATDRYPKVLDLARPLGSWIVDGIMQENERRDHNAAVDEERSEKLTALEKKLSITEFSGELTEEQLLAECTGLVRAAIDDVKRRRPQVAALHPSDEDIEPLRSFIYRDENTTAGYVWTYSGDNPMLGQRIINVQQQLQLGR